MKSSIVKSAIAALAIGASLPALACTSNDPTCSSSSDTTVHFGSSYQLDPNHVGIYIQNNTGNNAALSDLQHVVVRDSGDVSVSTAALGNTIQINLKDTGGDLALNHVNQTNSGNQSSVTSLGAIGETMGDVTLSSTAVGNNFSVTATNTPLTLATLSASQCNTGNMTAVTSFYRDPTSLTVNTTAVGNSIAISTNPIK
ncbi:MAG TPA: hypothetical protein VFX23_11455 [Limnobacter sp.]|uniref:hypothetical protein n=1 Tax=Limnobacter sp. TaxID=2003368 RepID=UPI002E327183|nr:hypothetical protein [Limnobacter sp.]HEX5486597.1 hypothetical protein [Limnobacter sp.]